MAATTAPPRKTGLRKWHWLLMVCVIFLLAAFLSGYIPESQKADRLSTELKTAHDDQHQMAGQLQVAAVRDQFSRAYLETTRNNFGVASLDSARAFDLIGNASPNTSNAAMKNLLQNISGQRGAVLSGLAKTDPNVRNQLAAILDAMDKAGR